jgi:hypothetical protein
MDPSMRVYHVFQLRDYATPSVFPKANPGFCTTMVPPLGTSIRGFSPTAPPPPIFGPFGLPHFGGKTHRAVCALFASLPWDLALGGLETQLQTPPPPHMRREDWDCLRGAWPLTGYFTSENLALGTPADSAPPPMSLNPGA